MDYSLINFQVNRTNRFRVIPVRSWTRKSVHFFTHPVRGEQLPFDAFLLAQVAKLNILELTFWVDLIIFFGCPQGRPQDFFRGGQIFLAGNQLYEL